MNMEILCFYAGIAFVYLNKLNALFLLSAVIYFRPKLSFVVWFLVAVFFGIAHQWSVSSQGMPHQLVIQNAQITGEVTSIPVVNNDSVQFTFTINRFNGKPARSNITVSCYQRCPTFHTGQQWLLSVKLKRPKNLGNPGHFDYERLLSAKHIDWTGYIQPGRSKLIRQHSSSYSVLGLREYLSNKFVSLDADIQSLGIIQALTLGVSQYIQKDDWDLFRRTGTTHLIDISGSHIGLVAGITFFMIRWMWARVGRLSLYCPAPRAGSIAALTTAFIYTVISGFSIPAQRAFFACALMLCRYISYQRFSIWQAFRYALLVVLVLDPHAILSAGFYLSFLGVAILIIVNQRVIVTGFRKTLLLQLACLLGMMPLTLFWFSYGALSGIIANLIAIPWVELWIVPLALCLMILPQCYLSSIMMFLLKKSIMIFIYFLHWIDAFSSLNLTFTFLHVAFPLALMITLAILICLPLRPFALPIGMMSMAALYPYHLSIKPGHARVDLLDVGQGLAVVIHTAHHHLIYDTGMKYYRGSDMGKLAIIPYLKSLGIHQIDAIVISHPDLDHRGGLASIEEQYPVHELIVESPAFYHRGLSCHDYPDWEWDSVRFRFFAIQSLDTKKNNHSCVLQVSTSANQVLLTGDIEKAAEEYLVNTYGHQLASSVLVIPHHGSKTSSSAHFVETVSPQYAIASYGFDNRYHFPHSRALSTYQNRQIPIINTVDCGMTSINLSAQNRIQKPNCFIDSKGETR
jgi:competence protein ComEC